MAKFCTNCGASLADDKKFCTECGTSMDTNTAANTSPKHNSYINNTTSESSAANNNFNKNNTFNGNSSPNMNQPANTYAHETVPPHGSKYEPISTWGYIGIFLLTCIPIIGLLFIIIWALGGCRKVNKRNMARASLILTLIGVIFAVIIGFAVKSFIDNVTESIQQQLGITDTEESFDFLGGLLGGNINLDDLQNLESLFGGSTNNNNTDNNGNTENNNNNLDEIFESIDEINQEAEEKNNGWPASLRQYPNGTATSVTSYRTEITDTTLEEMKSWIEDLKSDGFAYQDFYEMGISEADMLTVNAWWATDGKIYLSVSYNEGKVTVDHTNELPDMSDLLP